MTPRPIEFRIWAPDLNGKWCMEYPTEGLDVTPMPVIGLDGKAYMTRDEDFVNDTAKPLGILLPDQYTLLQFTGLYDKNGKKIFEGDIVRIPGQWWKDDVEFFNEEVTNMGIDLFYSGEWSVEPDEVEVIGNVWESPELLNNVK